VHFSFHLFFLFFVEKYYRFGLSYTTFTLSDLVVGKTSSNDANFTVETSVKVTNTGKVTGTETVQVYISPPASGLTHPLRQLKAFGKARDLAPGSSTIVKLELGKYAVSFWDETSSKWTAGKGEYVVSIGTSSEDLPLLGAFKLEKGISWTGL